ncbi:hypothetical protein ACHHYP_12830 [Achlya hypogyna]|uniref:Uncharacterized protein n=1 Tax=Achlya hypogyna TaxID=1202772 RepID=A0A1V9YGG1_ACHHY|nr:hypothetical protein ACHHYP_12830 [Achlya hypogyna]
MFHNQEAPVASVLCARREVQHNAAMLYENLKAPKGMCHVGSPRVFAHLEFKAKKATLQHEHQERIDHENLLLMEKMAHIMVPSAKNANQLPKIDNHNKYNLVCGYERTRLKQNARIAKENELYRRRIQAQKPTYSVRAFEAANEIKNAHLQRIHKQFVTSSATPAQLKADAIRDAIDTKRDELRKYVYEPQHVERDEEAPRLDPFLRNHTCICIDSFTPQPPRDNQTTHGSVAPRRPKGKRREAPHRLSVAEYHSIAEELEIEMILAENESILDTPSTSLSNDLEIGSVSTRPSVELDTLSSITLSDMEYIRDDFSRD